VKERDNWKRAGKEPLFREDFNVEAEESPLLEAVTRERLVKTAGWKRLSVYCSDLYSVEISDGVVIT
jgi:hypothetical protein